jgi:RNA polymerase sigma factor (sigma-70 family)
LAGGCLRANGCFPFRREAENSFAAENFCIVKKAGFGFDKSAMDDLIKYVRTYRVTAGLAERQRLAEVISAEIISPLHLFIYARIQSAADDVLQETLIAVVRGLANFRGNSDKEFYGWCHQIARHKIADHLRKKSSDRSDSMEPALLGELFDGAMQDASLSVADKMDLVDAMQMINMANPECYDFLWQHYVVGLDYGEIAAEHSMSYDAARMRVGRCLEAAQALFS